MRVRLLALFTLTFVFAYGSADLFTSLHPWRWPIAPTRWPFWPGWAAVYLSLDLLIPLTFWKIPKERLGALTTALLFCTLAAWPLFLLFPLPAIVIPEGEPSAAFQLADTMNLRANLFPSLHVAYALICGAFLAGPWSWIWGLAISFSTLVTHQHYTVDVVGGAILAYLGYRWSHHSWGRVEAQCLAELVRCATRHRRYALIGAGLYAASLLHPRRRRLARVGFCYLQHLDDLLDGHLSSHQEPEDIATAHQQALRGERPFDGPLRHLGQTLRDELKARGEGLQWAVAVIEEMKLDRRRARDGILLEEEELDRHLERTFELSINLMLLAADSPLRSAQLTHLVKSLGWCSVIRDYAEDQELGLVNVPKHRWLAGEGQVWLEERHGAVWEHLRRARTELELVRGQTGHRLLAIFLRSVEDYAAREGTSPKPMEDMAQ